MWHSATTTVLSKTGNLMNREQFIEYAETLSREELQKVAEEARIRSGSRIPEEVQKLFSSKNDVTDCEEMYIPTKAGNVHIYVIRKKDSEGIRPVMINIHGGGWALPHTERDIYFCRRIAERLDCLIVDIDYKLAPEYPYPAALEEIEALLEQLTVLLPQWKGDLSRVIICGQSAGGNLSAALFHRGNIPPQMNILSQILCYLPADNFSNRFEDAGLSERDIATEYYGFFYNTDFDDRKNPDVSLVFASENELKNVPRTDILTAGKDNLKKEAEIYMGMLKDFGTPVTYRCFENSRHGFVVNLYDEWREAEDYIITLFCDALQSA